MNPLPEIRFLAILLAALALVALSTGCVTIGARYCQGDHCAEVTFTPAPPPNGPDAPRLVDPEHGPNFGPR